MYFFNKYMHFISAFQKNIFFIYVALVTKYLLMQLYWFIMQDNLFLARFYFFVYFRFKLNYKS